MQKDYFLERLRAGRAPVDHSYIERKFLDVAYAGTSPAQKLDLYLPKDGDGLFPLVMYIHGGGFLQGDKTGGTLEPFLYGLERGYAIASLNYRLSGEAIFPAGVEDVKIATCFLRANAYSFHLDPQRFTAAGASAGAYYVAMLCVTGNTTVFDGDPRWNTGVPSTVSAGVLWFPPIDFTTMDEQLTESGAGTPNHNSDNSPEALYMGGPVPTLPIETLRTSNPETYLHAGIPPMLVQHGKLDRVVPYQQSVSFTKKAQAVAGQDRVRLELLDFADHADAQFETVLNMRKTFNFLDTIMNHQ
jgi:acetyl esterase/lipase